MDRNNKKNVEQRPIIPIVMAANDDYATYLGVAIHSLIKHTSKNYYYKIHVLQSDISETHKIKIKALEKENISIEMCDVSELMKGIEIKKVEHLSKETAYRLLADKMFSNYEKIIYIDCDLIVKKDVALLYQIDLNDYILGAVRACITGNMLEYISDKLSLPVADYFNAGVLLINLIKFRELKIGEKGLSMLSSGKQHYLTQDQDVLNLLCHKQVKYIDARWNVEWAAVIGDFGEAYIDEVRKGSLDCINEPYIIHYITRVKPWEYPEKQLAECFWMEARETVFYEEILFNNISSKIKKSQEKLFTDYLFPWNLVKANSEIIMYGYGNVGNKFYKQIKETQYCNIIAICDKNPQKVRGVDVKVIAPEELNEYEQPIVIAIEQPKVVNEIVESLKCMGVNKKRILWQNPIRK